MVFGSRALRRTCCLIAVLVVQMALPAGSARAADPPPLRTAELIPLGDADRDGGEDFIARITRSDDRTSAGRLEARDGSTGRLRWSWFGDAPEVTVHPDADDDGVADLLVRTTRVTTQDNRTRMDQRLWLASGRTGAERWMLTTTAIGGRAHLIPLLAVPAEGSRIEAVGTIPDVTADGRADVLLTSLEHPSDPTGTYPDEVKLYTTCVHDARDGSPVGACASDEGTAIAVVPTPDLAGDGTGDFLVGTAGPAPYLRAVAGGAATELWRRALPAGTKYIEVEPVTVPGSARVLVRMLYYPCRSGSGCDWREDVIDAATGDVLWSPPETWMLQPAGDVDRDGVMDFFSFDSDGSTTRIARVSGATGGADWVKDIDTGSPGTEWMACRCPQDLDGDGITDIQMRTVYPGEWNYDGEPLDTIALRGADGSQLWRVDAEELRPRGAADLDGDGIDDLTQEVGRRVAPGVLEYGVRTFRGHDLAGLWTAQMTFKAAGGTSWGTAFRTYQLDSTAGAEFVLNASLGWNDSGQRKEIFVAVGRRGMLWALTYK